MKVSRFLLAAISLSLVLACDRAPSEPVGKTAPAPALEKAARDDAKPARTSTPASSPAPLEPTGKFRHAAAERLVAIGDLHGDFGATERAFRLAGAIDDKGRWSGGKLVVVQTGDQLDRGDDERRIMDFLARLEGEAKAAGGGVHVLNGNHEIMNAMGDFRYVTEGAFNAFSDVRPASPLANAAPAASRGRLGAFLPGGGVALQMANRRVVTMVGDTVFVHGGLLPAHVRYGVDRLNDETAQWLRGERPHPPELLTDERGPVWARLYGSPTVDDAACETLAETLALLGAARLVVGHTVQAKGMSKACDDRVFRIDVGLSRYYGVHPVQVLEIKGKETRFLEETPG